MKLLPSLMLAFVAVVGLAACGSDSDPGTTSSHTAPPGSRIIHMDNTTFLEPAVTIKSNESLVLQADTFVPHFISNGTWEGAQARPNREEGAPVAENIKIDGNGSGALGPFPNAGTFQYYCTIHPKMSLSVTVE